MNHAFVYSSVLDQSKGMNGTVVSGLKFGGKGDGGGSLTSPYKVVDLQGKDEVEVFNKIRSWPGWNKTTWNCFGKNPGDCHAELEAAFKYAGVKYPGAPNGRIDWNEWYNSGIDQAKANIEDMSGSSVLFYPFAAQKLSFTKGISTLDVDYNFGLTLVNDAILGIDAIVGAARAMQSTFSAAQPIISGLEHIPNPTVTIGFTPDMFDAADLMTGFE